MAKIVKGAAHEMIPLLPLQFFDLIASSNAEAESMQNVLHEDTTRIKCIIGNLGVGKTRLLLSALHKWTAEYPSKRFLYFDMRERSNDYDAVYKDSAAEDRTGLIDILQGGSLHFKLDGSTIAEILKSEGKDTVILLDHLDDLDTSDPNTSAFRRMLSRELLPEARIITAGQFPSKETTTSTLLDRFLLPHGVIGGPCSYYILEGIKQGSELVFLENSRSLFKDDRLYENLKYHCPELCRVPGMVHELLATSKGKPQTASMGSTKLIEPLVLRLINQYIRKHNLEEKESNSLNTLSDNLKTELRLVGKLAYQFVESSTDNCCYSDLSRYVTLDSGVDKLGVGWLFLAKTVDKLGREAYKFVHSTIQEFLAAYYLATEPLLDQIRLVKENMDFIFTDASFRNMLKFYYGIGRILSDAKRTSNEVIPEAMWTRKPILETIIGSQLYLDEEPAAKRNKLLFIFQLLQESEDKNLARKFLSRREKYLELTLESSFQLAEPLVTNISFVISNSGILKWIVEASESAVHSAHFIKMLVWKESSNEVEVRINIREIADSDSFTIRPLVGSGTPLREVLPQSAYVKCMREVLYCFLQLHSPIRLKSNSSDTSYVSFLSCACLKDKIETERVLLLESINAVHWITVKAKETKHKSFPPKSSEEAELHHHMAMHNMEHLEMVFMLSPLPNRILYKIPSGGNTMESIELSHASAPSCLDGRIATSLQQHLRGDDEVADHRDIAVETMTMVGRLPPDLVTLPFIIPLSFKDIAGKVVTNSTFEHAQKSMSGATNKELPEARHEKTTESPPAPHPCTSDNSSNQSSPTTNTRPIPNSSMYSYHLSSQHLGSTPRLSSQPFISQQSVQQSLPAGAQKQVAAPPGTVLHTANPEIFTLNTIYSLPDENNLLRKGGNGTVFAVTYGRKEYAVKKTPFRNREFQIHKKLKHPNVIELSCFMFGPPQPQFKRRYYSFHFMPRVTGDLARMVTDRHDLVMTSLSTKYQNDPLQLGSIQGNWKFILKELLKGLSYMHSLKVVHRDMKASNVLINMMCSCDNPLTCTCSQKCSVTIADFDAALQLDSSGSLQATPLPVQQHKARATYQIMPVGTDGYRSPELSQYTVSNDLSVLTPALGVKTDIWSVGLILMRILNGSNGPARQNKLSTLLLYYEQEKCNERRQRSPKQRPKIIKVSKTEVDKILGIHKLGEFSNSWIRRAVQCISLCMEVDPEKRPDAQLLLKHSFLY